MPNEVSYSVVPWDRHHRIIPSRFPPISVFEDTTDPADLDAVYEVEALTNDRLRNEVGELSLVPPEDRISGPNSSVVMAAFTHRGKASRFNDEFFGAYYAGNSTEVAIAETTFHKEAFMRHTAQPPQLLEMREYVGTLSEATFVDIRELTLREILDPDPSKYSAGQAFARELRGNGENGILYPSVRFEEGECIAVFRPRAIGLPIQSSHFAYNWDGSAINKVWKLTEMS